MTVSQMEARFAARLLEIPGVVGVEAGSSRSGKEGLKIYTTTSEARIWSQLLTEMRDAVVAVEYIGHLNAHSFWYLPLSELSA